MANSDQLDLPILKDLHKSRRKLGVYLAEIELSEAKKSVEELTFVKVEEHGNYAEIMRDLVAMKEELISLKIDIDYVSSERFATEKEFEKLRFKTDGNLRLLECLQKEIEVANEEHFRVELRKNEALTECKEIEMWKEGKRKEVFDSLAEKNERMEEMLEEEERLKDIENELFETTSDVEMLKTQLKLVKKMKRRDKTMSRSNRSLVKKEEFASLNAELFEVMAVMDMLRNEILQAKEETARSKTYGNMM